MPLLRRNKAFQGECKVSIFDVLGGGNLGSVLGALTNTAKNAATNIKNNTPGGLPGLAGAGAIGAILGNMLGSDLVKNVALAGAGAVAWNFYKKWADGQQGGQAQQQQPYDQIENAPAGWGNVAAAATPARALDPTAELVLRAMTYAARADGNIDATEQDRMEKVMNAMLPGEDVSGAMTRIRQETIDPAKIAAAVRSHEQAEDVYRLSCAVIDVDHFMEASYLEALAKALDINSAEKTRIEAEAGQARRQLVAAAGA